MVARSQLSMFVRRLWGAWFENPSLYLWDALNYWGKEEGAQVSDFLL